MLIRYHPMKRTYKKNRGLAERQLRKRLEDAGWLVWRGGFIHAPDFDDLYPNVERKYTMLKRLLAVHHPGRYDDLCYFSRIQKGMPDFLCYRGEFIFVECKFLHEQLSSRQKKCLPRLQQLGFTVEVHKLVDHRTKTRRVWYDIETGKKKIIEKQCRLRLKW